MSKSSLKTRSLIACFEKGEGLNKDREDEDRQPEVVGAELAKPGMARKIRAMFDQKPESGTTITQTYNKTVIVMREEGEDETEQEKEAEAAVQNHVDETAEKEEGRVGPQGTEEAEQPKEGEPPAAQEEVTTTTTTIIVVEKSEPTGATEETAAASSTSTTTTTTSSATTEVEEVKVVTITTKEETAQGETSAEPVKIEESRVSEVVQTKVEEVRSEPPPAVEETKTRVTTVKESTAQAVAGDAKPAQPSRKVLLVFAHVFKESFEGSLVGAAVKALQDRGIEFQISNLYEMNFNPVASPNDFGGKIQS